MKCMEASDENLYIDISALRIKTLAALEASLKTVCLRASCTIISQLADNNLFLFVCIY